MEDTIFDIAFELDGKHYTGWVNPSDKKDNAGKPVSFHVVLNDESFGYFSFHDCRWSVNEDRPEGLVELIGKQIEKHYQI